MQQIFFNVFTFIGFVCGGVQTCYGMGVEVRENNFQELVLSSHVSSGDQTQVTCLAANTFTLEPSGWIGCVI